MSGRKRSTPTAKNATMIKLRRQRFKPRGSVVSDAQRTAWSLSEAGEYRLQPTGSCAHEENDEERGQRPSRLPRDRDAAMFTNGDCVPGQALVREAVQGERRAPEAWTMPRLVFLKNPDARLEKGAAWVPRNRTAECVLQVVHDGSGGVLQEKEPIEWWSLHVGAERGVICEHMQALLTNILQRHWEWQEDRRTD